MAPSWRSRPISLWLPNELITEIIEALTRSDRAALCRVSKLLHGLGVPVLYRVVKVTKLPQIETFCSAVLSNPMLTGLVQSFTVSAAGSHSFEEIIQYIAVSGTFPVQTSSSLSDLLRDPVRALSRLQYLSLDHEMMFKEQFDALLGCTFPSLASCDTWNQRTPIDTFAFFLARHSAMTYLRIHLGAKFESPFVIPLPSLQHFEGPVELIPWISTRRLRHARIDWGFFPKAHNIEASIVALGSLTCSDIPVVISSSWCGGNFLKIIDSVSRYIPHTKALITPASNLNDEQIVHVGNCLLRFTSLEFLSVESSSFLSMGRTECADYRTAAQNIGNLCPTLTAYLVGNEAWNNASGTWETFPSKEFRELCERSFGKFPDF
ncbi:hypothetical protein DFH07DRAFT_785185 [Mycena maculata]|uniref:F-box domain-containing protein n=1 Tax=Mycena maculata TaxID=230809 RepID=A0AAD7MH81_9AGAR|nr:hypothetical protein DFH07DRAFT_785185 [Mycena maculata]